MTEMVKSYINHYNRAQKADKASIIPKMNQEWPLRDTINKVIEAPLSSKMRKESHRRDAYESSTNNATQKFPLPG